MGKLGVGVGASVDGYAGEKGRSGVGGKDLETGRSRMGGRIGV